MSVNVDAYDGFGASPMQNLMNSFPIKRVKSSPIIDIVSKKYLWVMSVAPNCFTSDIASGYISDPLIRSKGIIAKTFFFVLLKVSKFSTETS